jgi:hypothetical protein
MPNAIIPDIFMSDIVWFGHENGFALLRWLEASESELLQV